MNVVVVDCTTGVAEERLATAEEAAQVEADRAAAEAAAAAPKPLDRVGALATLLAVEGTVTVADAANAVSATEQALIDEALAWSLGNV